MARGQAEGVGLLHARLGRGVLEQHAFVAGEYIVGQRPADRQRLPFRRKRRPGLKLAAAASEQDRPPLRAQGPGHEFQGGLEQGVCVQGGADPAHELVKQARVLALQRQLSRRRRLDSAVHQL